MAKTKITRAACPTVTENSSARAGSSVSQARSDTALAKQQALSSQEMEFWDERLGEVLILCIR